MVRETGKSLHATDITVFLRDAAAGDDRATSHLFEAVYESLRTLAARYLNGERRDHTLQPTALVHEAYLKLVGARHSDWNDRAHFFAVAARAMRRILINHAIAKRTAKRGGDRQRSPLTLVAESAATGPFDLIVLDDALKRLAMLDERQSRIVEMRFFGGLTNQEVAGVLGVSLRTIEGEWAMARAWLLRALSEDSADDQ